MLSRRTLIGHATALMTVATIGEARSEIGPISVPKLRRGVNTWPWFSLTREFPSPRTDYDWPPFQQQRPVPSRSDLRRLSEAGLDFIRLPVDPGPFLSFSGDQRRRLLSDLFAAVEQTLAAGLAVVVNIQANEATHYWNSRNMTASREAPEFQAYQALVGDIAHGLATFDRTRVALEPINEPFQQCGSQIWLETQAALFGTARRQAPDLTLVATGSCGSMVQGLEQLDPTSLRRFDPVIFTFHFYEPYLFSHQGAPWMKEPVYRALNAVPWPASSGSLGQTLAAVRDQMARDTALSPDAKASAYRETERVLTEYFAAQPDRRYIEGFFAKVKGWADRYGISRDHILLGEFGALRSDARYTASHAADRARYVRDVRVVAEEFGFPWTFWDLFDGMGIMDDATRAFDPAMMTALGLALPRS